MKTPALYTQNIMKYFKSPKNVGKIKNPDGTGRVGNAACGDIMEMYIKIRKMKNGKEKIADVKFQTFGCVVALAVSSMLTEMAKGKTLDDALKLTNKDILKKAGPVPPIKVHCSFLAADALHEAIYDYFSKSRKAIPESLQKEHERIQNSLKQVEHSHHELTQMEEKML
ncbi:MAG: iron-sulfur cluster assembly scaffold protein [Candidatus Aenigmatarchaeota archaeon]